MSTPSQAAPPVDLNRLVRLVENAIRSTNGRMFLDIHIDEDLTKSIEAMIREELRYGKSENDATQWVVRRIFSNHEESQAQAARDDANMAMNHAFDSLSKC